MSEEIKGHIINHTHWDREWRYPIWETRLMLIDFMDELIDLMEKNVYVSFLMDGQVIPVLDYLEVRPEMKDRVKALVKSGRLEIGPWYVLPDEFTVDGEALVRNLLWGHKKSAQLGRTLKIGYTSFGWGQTAQLAQIYNDFGMKAAFIGKRVSKDRAPESEFLWKSPDGSELVTSRFGEWGRQNFYYYIHLPSIFGIDHLGKKWYCKYDKGVLFHRSDPEQCEQDMFQLKAPDKFHPNMITSETVDHAWHSTDESIVDSDRLMMNGCDYAAAQPMLQDMLKKMKEVDKDDNRTWKQSSITDFTEAILNKIDKKTLPVVKGELRDGPAAWTSGNALMTRSYLKRLNKKAENMLIRFAEPLAAVASINGAEYQRKMLDIAWDNLLQSHPHDSINGVTQDDTANDVQSRLNTVASISQAIGNRAMQEIVKQVDLSGFDKDDVLIMVFNPLPYERNEYVEAMIDIPASRETYEFIMPSVDSLQVFDSEAKPVSTQWMGVQERKYPVHEIHTRAFPFFCKRHRVVFDAGQIPACGYKVFRVSTTETRKSEQWSDSQARTSDLLKAPNILENKYLRVKVNSNGTFDLLDKENGQNYCDLNYYEDHGEHGDYWTSKRPASDQAHNTLGANARMWVKESGPLQASIVTEVTLEIPQKGDKNTDNRSEKLEPMKIQTCITLKAESKQVDIEVDFENRHEDHYLRAMLPTGLKNAETVSLGEHFNVHERSIKTQGPDDNSYWPCMARLPQDSFIDVSDGSLGFAVLNDSLVEYEVSNTDERVIGLTLLRAVRNGVCTELRAWSHFESQKGGQCLGEHKYKYAIRLHSGNWETADIDLRGQLFNSPVRVIQTNAHSGNIKDTCLSMFKISNPRMRFSCIKKAENSDNYILRIYNPCKSEQSCSLVFNKRISKAWETNLNEERVKEITVNKDGDFTVKLAAKKICTIELEL